LASLRKSKFVASYFGWLAVGVASFLLIAYAVIPIVFPGMEFSTVVQYVGLRVMETQELKGGRHELLLLVSAVDFRVSVAGSRLWKHPILHRKLEGVAQMGVGVRLVFTGDCCRGGNSWDHTLHTFPGDHSVEGAEDRGGEKNRAGGADIRLGCPLLDGCGLVQRITLVGIVQDVHLWVMFGLGFGAHSDHAGAAATGDVPQLAQSDAGSSAYLS